MPVSRETLEDMHIDDKPAVFNHIIGTLYTDQKQALSSRGLC
jgi:hypothetical protein